MQESPLCPNCRERMSDVERGLGGVWSCLYCEAVWLPNEATNPAAVALPDAFPENHLICPACESSSLHPIAQGSHLYYQCAGCSGAFLPKGVVRAVCPGRLNPAAEAHVPQVLLAAIASSLLLAPELLLSKLASAAPRQSAA